MVKNNHHVCVFDSGIGGINLLYECVRKLPSVDFTYFADNFRVPYGNIEKSVLTGYVDEIFIEIEKLNPSVVLIACNTVTANCIEYLRKKYNFPILGIQPAVKPAVEHGGKCLVLATPSTAQSESMKSLINKYGDNRTQVAAIPRLASLIEEKAGKIGRADIEKLLPSVKPDTVVLGCTHYIYVKDIIKEFYNCPIFDGAEGTVRHLCEILGKSDHQAVRAQKVAFFGGDCPKNRKVFADIVISNGGFPRED